LVASVRITYDALSSKQQRFWLDLKLIALSSSSSPIEERFQACVEARYAVGVSSATAGLHLALLAAGIGHGDEVLTTPMTFQ
jgi:dTDP-4-amino-4,6-dideoxygalactose transaminase